MKEKILRQKLRSKLEKQGMVWFPPKVKFMKEADIFGIYDCVFYKGSGEVHFIQMTTKTNLSHRAKKMSARFQLAGSVLGTVYHPIDHSYIYAYDENKNDFVVIKLNDYLAS